MRPSRRRLLLVLLAAVAGVVLALLLGWFPQEPARLFMERRLQDALGPGARVGRLRVWPGRLYAEIEGLLVDAPAYRLEARTVRVRLNRRTLLGPAVAVRSLEADGVALLIRGDVQAPGARTAALAPLVIDSLRVTEATVRYEGTAVRGAVVLDGVALGGALGRDALELSAGGGRWEGPRSLALGPARARVRVSPALDLHLEAFEAGLRTSRIAASGPLGSAYELRPDLTWNALVELSEIAAPAALGDASGTLRARGTLRSAGLAAAADLTGEHLRYGAWSADHVEGRVTHEGGRSTARLDARLLGGASTMTASYEGTSLQGRLDATGLDLARLAGSPSLAGRVSGALVFHGDTSRAITLDMRVTAEGRRGATPFRVEVLADGPVALDGPAVSLDWAATGEGGDASAGVRLQGSGRASGGLPPKIHGQVEGEWRTAQAGELPFAAEVQFAGGAFDVEGAVHGLGEPLTVRASAQGDRFGRLEVAGNGIALARFVPGLSGQARLAVAASGRLDRLSGRASLQLEDAAWRGVEAGPASVELAADSGAARFELHVPAWNASGGGTIAADRLRSLRGRIDLRDAPLDRLGALLPEGPGVSGTLTGVVDLDVPLARPAEGVVHAEVQALDVTRGGLRLRNRGPAMIAWRGKALHVERLDLVGAGFEARAAGTLTLRGSGGLDLRLAGEAELDALPFPPEWTVAGRITTDVRVGGTRAQPQATGHVAFQDAGLATPSLPAFSIAAGRLHLDGDALVFPDLPVDAAGGRIVLSGRVPIAAALPAARARRDRLAPGEGADVSVAWSGLRAEEWPQGEGETRLAGALAGTLALTGGLASLREAHARLEVPATTLRIEEVEVRVEPFGASLEDGTVRLEPVQAAAADSAVQVEGSADLAGRRIDATALGALNLRALSPFVTAGALFGTAELDVSASGAWSAPEVRGTVTVDDASLRLRLLPQAVTSLQGDIVFDGRSLRVPRATAVMGGGDLTLAGEVLMMGGLADARFVLTGRDVTLAYPPGLRSRLDADLTLSGGPGAYRLAGDVRVVRGLYDLDLVFEQSLSAPEVPASESPALRRIALDLRVEIQNAIQVRNNMAELQAAGAITVRGDMNAPAPVGSLEIEPAGQVYLSGRPFEIESGRLTFRGNWDPQVEIEATDLIRGADANAAAATEYEVTVRLVGSIDRPGLQLSSDPPLSEGQIVSLIATGRTDRGGTGLQLALGGQAAALLAGRLTRRLRDLGLDEVSIQPELVAREGENETGARFTFGKRLTSRLELVYSLSLQDPEARFILVEARPGLGVVLRGQRNDAGTLTGSAGQRFQFGGPPRRRAASADRRVRLAAVRFEGDVPIPEAELARLAGTEPGQRKTVWDLQDDADELRSALLERGYLEAEVGVRLEEGAAVFRVRTGARYDWRVEGASPPRDLEKRIREALFEEEALARGEEALLLRLHEQGHLRARVRTRVEAADGRRTLVFVVEPGPRYEPVEVVFPGAQALSADRLVEEAGGAGRLVSKPAEAERAIEDAYRRAFHLLAEADPPELVEIPRGGLRIVVAVREGPRAVLGTVRFEEATRPTPELQREAGLRVGEPYDPAAALAATDRLREYYFRLGYGDVRVQAAAVPSGPQVDLVFTIQEGRRAVLGRIVIQGLRRTREALVRRQVRLRPGAPLDPRRLASLERRLLDMGLFSRVVTSVSAEDPATLTITVDEDDRFFGRYALSYEKKRTLPGQEVPNFLERSTAEVDAEVRNLLGWGASAGARGRVGADVRDASASIGIPSLPFFGNFSGTVFRIQEDLAITPDAVTGQRRESRRTQTGFEASWSRRLPRRTELLYGYRFEDSEVVSPDFAEPQTARTAALRGSVLRDTRDSILDARNGRFLSVSVDYAPAFVHTDFTFIKGLAQAFLARPVGRSLTWAQGWRVGLGTGFGGQTIRSTERFQAGGGNTIRGYETDSVGPFDPLTRTFTGGEAVLIVNQELRYRHASGLGGVVFYDAGNVFRRARDLDLDWRHAVGAGLRWDSPVGLLRLDVGFPLARRVLPFDPPRKEDAFQLFFSLGQAF